MQKNAMLLIRLSCITIIVGDGVQMPMLLSRAKCNFERQKRSKAFIIRFTEGTVVGMPPILSELHRHPQPVGCRQ